MSRREKFIVSVMAASVLLGGYLYLSPWTTGNRQEMARQAEGPALDFARQVIRKLGEDTSLVKDLYSIRSAERNWQRDPFLKTDKMLSDAPGHKVPDEASDDAGTPLLLVYSGFLEAGTQRLAIINGIEYATGEAVGDQGHYIRRIQSHQVEIGKRHAPDVIVLKLAEVEAITGK